MHLEFFERLFQQDSVDRISHFLGVGAHEGAFNKKRNVSVKMALHPRLRVSMVQRLEPQYTYVRDLFKGEIPSSWHTDLYSLRDVS
jgi:hypothetical protein